MTISYVWLYRVKVGILKNHTYLSLKLDIIHEFKTFEFGLNRWMTVSFYSPAHRSVQMLKGQRSQGRHINLTPFFPIPILSCTNKQPDLSEHALHCHSKYSSIKPQNQSRQTWSKWIIKIYTSTIYMLHSLLYSPSSKQRQIVNIKC